MKKLVFTFIFFTTFLAFAQPSNDDCDNAIELIPSLDIACTSNSHGTVLGATASAQANSCSYSTDDDDVWYKFTATSQTHKIIISNVSGSSIDLYFAVYTNVCSSLGTQILCSDNNSSNLVNLTIGNTYFVRVYTKTSIGGQTTEFDICVSTPPNVPLNNECSSAPEIFVNPVNSCDSLQFGTINGATNSTQVLGCTGTVNNDVWYSFIANSSAEIITITTLNESPLNYYHSVYAGTCVAPGNPIKCSDPEQSTVTGLIVGQRYFIRIFSTSLVPDGMVSDFSICVSDPPTPPVNDECIAALSLPVNNDFSCTQFLSGNVTNALQSTQPYICSDNNYIIPNDDIWYKFTATRTTHSLSFFDLAGSSTNINYTVSRGSCANLNTPILCGSSIADETNTLSNLTIGTEYFVRVFSSTSVLNQTTSFSICIGSQPLPPNDECSGAIQLNVNPTNTNGGVSITALYATQSNDLTDCPSTDLADIWYKFTALDTNHIVNITGSYLNSGDHFKYDLYSGTCNNLTSMFCDRKYANQLQNLQIGETYYLKFHAAQPLAYYPCSVTIKTVSTREANDECANAPLIDINEDIVCDSTYTGSFFRATPSMFPTNFYSLEDDVWIKFKASSPSHAVTVTNPNISNSVFDLYFYKKCSDAIHFAAGNYTNSFVVSGLIPDSIYLMRVASGSNSVVVADSFIVCIKNAEVPTNDDLVNALPLIVNDTTACLLSTSGSVYKATASIESNTCSNESVADNDDVWFSLIPTYSSQFVTITRTSGTLSQIRFALYSYFNSNLVQIGCYSSDASLSNLIVGGNYLLRVYTSTITADQTTNFTICVTSPQINDECQNSVELPVNQGFECWEKTSWSLEKSTPSAPNNTCTNSSENDVWFHFTATDTSHWITFPYGYDIAYSVYNGTCGVLGSPIACQDGTSPYFHKELYNLIPGNSYFIRVYKEPGQTALTYFDICISTQTGDIPPNDNCAGAIEIPVNDSYDCDTTLSCAITTGVSPSYYGTTQCNATNDDVWYTFVANSTKMEISFENIDGYAVSKQIAMYAGNCSSLLTLMTCGSSTTLNSLVVGNTYYLRIFSPVYPSWPVDQFSICLKKYFIPENDNCANAFEIPVTQGIYCDSSVHGTLFHATNSSSGGNCGSVVPLNDVWFKFTATSTKHNLSLQNITNTPQSYNQYDLRWSVYSGNCNNLGATVFCSTYGAVSFGALTNLIIGNTYYVRVYNSVSTSNLLLNFDVCLTIPPPPANDECVNATLVQSEVDNSCTITASGTLNNATPSIQANSCSNTNDDDDVWYKFVANSPTHAVNLLNVLGSTDIYHSVYSGTCANLINLSCNDVNSSILPNLTPDSIYYVRVYSTSNLAQTTTFNICTGVYLPLPTCTNNQAAGNDCQNALALCDFNGYCGRTSGTYTTETWPEFSSTFCGTLENNSFVSFVPDTDSLALNVWVTSSVTNLGIQVFIFDAENCAGPVQNLACWDPNYVPPGHKQITASGLIPGHKYYMMIDGQSGDICDYVFGSDASISSPITISPQQVDICLGDSVLLTASGGDGTFDWNPSSDITLVSENSIYFKPSHLDSNRVRVSSFTNSSSCGPNSEIEYQINVRSCVCPIIASNNSDSCVSNAFDLFVSDVFGASFEWQDANGVISNLQNPTAILAPQIAGSHTYTVTATSGTESCSTQTIVTINEIPNANFTYSDTSFCQLSTNPLPQIEGIQGGVFSVNTFDTEVNPISGEINLSNTLIGSYQITYTTPGVCPQSKSLEIDVINFPSAQAVSDQTICFGESFAEINFIGSLGSEFSWTNSNPSIALAANGNGNIASFTPTLDNQQAEITLIPSNIACVGTPITFNLNVLEKVSLDSIPNQTVCLNDIFQEIVFSGSNATAFSWTNSNPTIGLAANGIGTIASFQSLVGSEEAIIEVQASNDVCQGEIRNFKLFVNSLPEVTLEDFDTICNQNDPFELFGGLPVGGTYSGDSIVGNYFIPFYFFIANVEITYTYTDPLSSCTNSATSSINIQHCESIEENSLASLFKIYPNPSSGLVTIESTEQFNFELIDAVGKVVEIGNQSSILNLENYAQGVYELKIRSDKGTLIYKLVRN